jgi:hypothetical protein
VNLKTGAPTFNLASRHFVFAIPILMNSEREPIVGWIGIPIHFDKGALSHNASNTYSRPRQEPQFGANEAASQATPVSPMESRASPRF